MPLINPEQLLEIRQIIQDYHDAFVVNTVSPESIDTETLKRLQEKGLIDIKIESAKDAYLYGQLLEILQNPSVTRMSYEAFKAYLRKNPIPLTTTEQHAVRMAAMNAAQYCKGLGNRVNLQTGGVIIEADQRLRAEMERKIKTATTEAIERRKAVKSLKSDLGWATKDWARDWDRISVTEKQWAMLTGQSNYLLKQYGTGVYVARTPMPDACKHCKRLHLGSDGHPRIFKLMDLEGNGTNVGRKAVEWLPTVGPIHPYCQCQTVRVPTGWGFNEEGDLVPGGEFGERYESAVEMIRALKNESDLQKSFKLQGHINFQGLSVAVENRKGSIRRWKAPNGEMGQTKLTVAYGYIKGTNGSDQDEIDAFIGPNPNAENVYIISQQSPETGQYDEEKCMLGFSNKGEAEKTYCENFDFPEKHILYITPMSMDQFKRYIAGTKPKQGEMVKSENINKKIRFVIPLKKAQIAPEVGAQTSRIGNRNPSPGTSTNYVVKTPIRKRPDPYPYAKEIKDVLSEPTDGPESLKRNRDDYDFREPCKIRVRSQKLPENDIRGEPPDEDELRSNRHMTEHQLRHNEDTPRNMMEIAKKKRKPIKKDEDEDEQED